MIRALVVRLHLAVAVVAGAVILMMAVTGVVLSLEDAATGLMLRRHHADAPEGASRVGAAEIAAAGEAVLGAAATALRYRADERAPVRVEAGRDGYAEVSLSTGAVLGVGPGAVERFFEGVRAWHRWFNVPDGSVRRARAVTGAANLAFLFLLLTGPVLWAPWPPSRRGIARGLVGRRVAGGGRSRGPDDPAARRLRRAARAARSLSLHKVAGIWTVLPMAGLAVTGMATSYPALGDRMAPAGARMAGQGLGSPPMGAGAVAAPPEGAAAASLGDALDGALAAARSLAPEWRTLVVWVPRGWGSGDGGDRVAMAAPGEVEVRVEVLMGGAGQPQRAGVLTVDAATGAALAWESFADASPGRRGQEFLLYAHTGEYWGWAGRAVAGVAALAAAFMVWTGMSMAIARARRWKASRRA